MTSPRILLTALAVTLPLGAAAVSAQVPPTASERITGLTGNSLSLPHVHTCQRGFEDFFGVPEGVDPDEAVLIRGARQKVESGGEVAGEIRATMTIDMPYERMLPGGTVATGQVTCHFMEDNGAFPTTPYRVVIAEGEDVRDLDAAGLALFR